jgi:flagellar protein FliS
MTANPYQKYQASQVQTASKGELVVLLYDGAVKFLSRAVIAIEQKRFDSANDDIVRGQNIVLELLAGLDTERGGELAGNLRRLYVYLYETLLDANIKKDVARIQLVIRLLDNVRGAWRTVVRGGMDAAEGQRGYLAAGVAA